MALRKCDKCGQMVDEAKAFCPSCDNVFVEEEQRQDVSNFERQDKTVQLGNTMYDMMLSDMGLNIAKKPKPEKRIEVIAPIAASPAEKRPQPREAERASGSPKWVWIGLGLFALLVLLPFAVFSIAILIRAVMAR
jgi:hypothetical protein